MLAGMDQNRLNLRMLAQLRHQRGHLHHVRPGADNAHYSQAVVAHPALFPLLQSCLDSQSSPMSCVRLNVPRDANPEHPQAV